MIITQFLFSSLSSPSIIYLRDFFFRLKPKQKKKMSILQIICKNIWKLIKQNKLFDGIFDDPYLTE
jgi:hypothetical protein